MRQIDKAEWEIAHRLFQVVAVASRPLRVEELSGILAFDFEAGPIPKFHEDWRVEDPVNEVLRTCSSLLAAVDDSYQSQDDGEYIVGKFIHFSHFSVREYLMSSRLAHANGIIPRNYHLSATLAHTLVVRTCLGMLFHLDKDVVTADSLKELSFALYAAGHWADHARLEDVWQNVEDGVKQLFDPSKPHLAVCIWIHNPDIPSQPFFRQHIIERPEPLNRTTLHYAALWGLHSIVESLVIKHPQDVHSHYSPNDDTPLHSASKNGHVKVARFLLEHGANLTALNVDMETPLHLASERGRVEVANLLIERGADVSACMNGSWDTPLHVATCFGHVEVARLLIEHGADVTVNGDTGWTPLHVASRVGGVELATLLIECGADVATQTGDSGYTPLDLASRYGHLEVAGVLIDLGADVTAQKGRRTPLHIASLHGEVEIVGMLIERGSDVTAQDEDGKTPLHVASRYPGRDHFRNQIWQPHVYPKIARILLKHGADVTVQDKKGRTPFDVASLNGGYAGVARILLQHMSQTSKFIPTSSQLQRVRSLPDARLYCILDVVPDT